jgi:hypothetical protein
MNEPLNPDALIAQAEAATGLRYWGDDSFRKALQVFIQSLARESGLGPAGVSSARQRLLTVLQSRLRLYGDRARHPSIAAERIERPIIITGLPRSGTTFLHELLAKDSRNRVPLLWETRLPSPPPERESHDRDPRIRQVDDELAQAGVADEKIRAMHPFHARLTEECGRILEYAFTNLALSAYYRVSSYVAWRDEVDFRPAYALHKDSLQNLQWHCAAERWVLKSPEHLYNIDALLETYPDALVVMTHRDPLFVIPSVTSLIGTLRRLNCEQVDAREVADENIAYWAKALERTHAARQRPGQAGRFIDVHYRDLAADPIGTVARVYEAAHVPFTPSSRAAIEHFLVADTASKHGRHEYSLADAGLCASDIDHAFGPYLEWSGVRR